MKKTSMGEIWGQPSILEQTIAIHNLGGAIVPVLS